MHCIFLTRIPLKPKENFSFTKVEGAQVCDSTRSTIMQNSRGVVFAKRLPMEQGVQPAQPHGNTKTLTLHPLSLDSGSSSKPDKGWLAPLAATAMGTHVAPRTCSEEGRLQRHINWHSSWKHSSEQCSYTPAFSKTSCSLLSLGL